MSTAIVEPEIGLQPFRFTRPTLPALESVLRLYRPAYASGLVTNSKVVARLEAAAAERLGVPHAVAVSSCTSGLMLLLRALDLRGEVVLPSLTFFATGHAVLWNGLTPVFADCDPETWNIDPADAERRITRRTCAILGVHLYGNPCAVEALERVAARRRVKLIFDAAHAFGSRHGTRAVGGFGDAEAFSLSPTKLLVAGEGGLVTTGDAVLARRLRAARNYGDPGTYDPELLGLNARMSEFPAALALAGLDLVDAKVARHNRIAHIYESAIARVPGLSMQRVRPGDTSTYKDFSVTIDPPAFGRSRDDAAALLRERNIETRQYFYPPLHRQKLYRPYVPKRARLATTERISAGILSLPIYESLPLETVEMVALALRRLASASLS